MYLKQSFSRLCIAAVFSLSAFASASAATYTTLDTDKSRIGFAYSQMGVGMEGGFKKLDAVRFSFDTERPEAAQVAVDIPLASVDAGYDEANTELEKSDWLDTAKHPVASFESTKVEALGGDRFQVTGQLTIKGKAQTVSTPFTFKKDGGSGVFEGAFTLQRADFNIGEGGWADFSIVANDIQITFHVVATP